MPALILEPQLRERIARSPRRAAYYCSSVAALDATLRDRGTALTVRRGAPAATVRKLARECGARTVGWSVSYDAAGVARDRELQAALEEAGLRTLLVHDAPAVPPESTAEARSNEDGTGYRSFPAYFAMWRRIAPAPASGELRFAARAVHSEPLPSAADFPRVSASPDAGEATARRTLEAFLAGPALRYASGRFAMSEDCTSRLSAPLSFGTLSARATVSAVRARAADPFLLAEERISLGLFERALARRDFFLQLAWFFEEREDEPLQAAMRDFPMKKSHPLLDAWRSGRTGFPLVDAGMRELAETGWMHPHVRAIAASFLCFDLGIDWRVGREEWDRLLVEDDPALASGNWQWIAGVGADLAQYPRIYNPDAQARRFDPLGLYVRRWIPELAGLPLDRGDGRQLSLTLYGDGSYPQPSLDHAATARAFLARYRAFRERAKPR